jgi:hypothetical protein
MSVYLRETVLGMVAAALQHLLRPVWPAWAAGSFPQSGRHLRRRPGGVTAAAAAAVAVVVEQVEVLATRLESSGDSDTLLAGV